MNDNKSISKLQLFFLLVQTQIGIGLLSLPSVIQKTADGDAWISTILAGIGIEIMLVIYWLLLKRFPKYILPEITVKITGKFLGRMLNIFYYIYFLSTAGFVVIIVVRLIKLWLLPGTPTWVISLLLIVASVYLAIDDLKIIARFFTLATSLLILLILLSFLNFTQELDIRYVLPIGKSGIKNIILGSNDAIISMLGIEMLLFSFPFILNKKKGVFKTFTFASLCVTTLYTYSTFVTLLSFSPEILKNIREPILFIFRGLAFKVIDRLDLVFVSIWIVPMTTSIVAYLFMASKSISKHKKTYRKMVIVNSIVIFLISLIPINEKLVNQFSKMIMYGAYCFVFILPTVLLLFAYILRKKEMDENL
ncbi:GerAB/ArcD/ProY family transporter [Peribacillus alkalitolerans]|uniref:GerAB/ArcD/ProY family transporter n=1 Tax=Peribacillus alkalitolerans TaxID=1550385 RepID=UPI0013D0F063|nr:GerAB/ArcD/ProY family transporter [Peribacillus alkalitolerans]